ncbi:MAG: zinc ribbon domain-containing protein [Candidatus Aminicenantales bacterium]
MAIRRCPYCKAIIDEQDKYCNNCGTQLLFPEDEYVEEEIPGDKIIDEDEDEEEEQEEEELLVEEREKTGVIEEEEEISEELEKPKEEEESEEEEPKEEEPEEEEELEEPAEQEEEEEEEKEAEEIEERVEAVTEEPEEEEDLEQRLAPPSEEDAAKKYQVSIEEDELVFKTKDLDNLTGTVDEGKENLEEFLESFQENREETKRPTSDTGEELPPWVSGMKGRAPSGEIEEEKEEETTGESEEEKPPTRPEWTTDSGIGIPERVTQAGLPFGDTAAPATGEEREVAAEEESEEEEEAGREIPQRPGFSLKLKAKLVDLVFITALWLISLWFTSQVIGVSFFRIIAGSPGPVLAFYFILLLLYFFLFLYFLGETLGDHYFSEED